MTTANEEIRWTKLRNALEERFTAWELAAADAKAESIVYDLQRSGYRLPLPKGMYAPPSLGRPLRPEVVRRHAAACREAIRQPSDA